MLGIGLAAGWIGFWRAYQLGLEQDKETNPSEFLKKDEKVRGFNRKALFLTFLKKLW